MTGTGVTYKLAAIKTPSWHIKHIRLMTHSDKPSSSLCDKTPIEAADFLLQQPRSSGAWAAAGGVFEADAAGLKHYLDDAFQWGPGLQGTGVPPHVWCLMMIWGPLNSQVVFSHCLPVGEFNIKWLTKNHAQVWGCFDQCSIPCWFIPYLQAKNKKEKHVSPCRKSASINFAETFHSVDFSQKLSLLYYWVWG